MLQDSIRTTITKHKMLTPGDVVIVGVSGGADSVALLHVLWSLRDELRIEIIVAHLNHGIRGAEADADAEFVRNLAAHLGVPVVVEKVDVPRIREEERLGMEEAARQVRYAFLTRVAESANASKIAVAHTSDDQVETVLLNIIRGSGPDGLSGMPAVRGKIIRPLIDVSRREVEAYLLENGLSWRTDATNLEVDYTRNRIRLKLIPLLQEEFNPRVKDAILSLSRLVADESDVVRQIADAVPMREGLDFVEFDAAMLRDQPVAVKRRCVRNAIERVKGDLRDVEYAQVERIAATLSVVEARPITLTLPSGVVYAKITPDTLRVFKTVEAVVVEVSRQIKVQGRTDVPELGLSIDTRPVPTETRPTNPNEAVIDPSKIVGRLVVRTRRDGDRIVPLGMTGHKKLQDIFVDHKVPRQQRGLIPIIEDDEKIVWVGGLVLSDLVKVTRETQSALGIEIIDA